MLDVSAGVSKLTRTEVRSDLEEIEVLASGGLLAALEDIRVLPSVYPVKPRLELKIPEHLRAAQRAQQLAAGEDSQGAAGELLEFLRLVEVVRPDILDGEREREQLECKYMVSRRTRVLASQSPIVLTGPVITGHPRQLHRREPLPGPQQQAALSVPACSAVVAMPQHQPVQHLRPPREHAQ